MASDPVSGHQRAAAIVGALLEAGVNTFFMAPGSRSTPLVLQVARHSAAEVYVHTDERGVAFAALGYARACGKPAAVITTSGTAVANLYPAVIEASTDAQPLIVLSADRPARMRETGANQTIDQVQIFGSYVRHFADLGVEGESADIGRVRHEVRIAISAATGSTPGPVQVNCQFAKPLAPPYDRDAIGTSTVETQHSRSGTLAAEGELPTNLLSELAQAERGVVVVGRIHRRADAEAAMRFADVLGYPIVADIASQFPRVGGKTGSMYLNDETLRTHANELPNPDLVLHLGGRLVSTRVGDWLRSVKPRRVVHAAFDELAYDPFDVITDRAGVSASSLTAAADALVEKHAGELATVSNEKWVEEWRTLDRICRDEVSRRTGESPGGELTGPQVAGEVWNAVPDNWSLLLGNSLPVRDFDNYAWGEGPRFVATNRGASGIDGMVSTAFGLSVGAQSPTLAVLGDLTTLHDLNALALLERSPWPVVILVVNNGGGAIFGQLPIAEHVDVFAQYFQVAHEYRFRSAAEMFGIPYSAPEDRSDLRRELASVIEGAREGSRSALIEVRVAP